MKKYIKALLLILLILWIQISFPIKIKDIQVDIFFILIVSFSLTFDIKESIIMGGISGFLEDLFSGGIIGTFLLLYTITSFFVSYIKRQINKDYINILIPIIVFIFSLFIYKIGLILYNILNIKVYSHTEILKISFANFLFSPLIYLFIYIIKDE